MSFVSAVSFSVRNLAQAQRWYPALVNAQLVQSGGYLVAGRAPATLARVVVQSPEAGSAASAEGDKAAGHDDGESQIGITFPYLGIATSNMTKSRRDLERFGGPLNAADTRLKDIAALMDYPEPVLNDPSNKRVLPTAATVADPDLANHMAVFHTFNRNSIAKVLLPHVDMAAAEAVWSAVGLWDGEKRYPSDTELIHKPAADMPPTLLSDSSRLLDQVNESLVLHVDVPDLQTALDALRSCGGADVLDMEWNDTEAKSMGGVSGGAIVLDPTGYCMRVCQATR